MIVDNSKIYYYGYNIAIYEISMHTLKDNS